MSLVTKEKKLAQFKAGRRASRFGGLSPNPLPLPHWSRELSDSFGHLASSPPESSVWQPRCEKNSFFNSVLGRTVARSLAAQERRNWDRLPLAIPIFVRGRDAQGKEFLEFATALNLSAGGALLALSRALPVSSGVSVEVPSAPLSDDAHLPRAVRRLRARVVHARPCQRHQLVGLKFSRPLLKS